MKPAWWAKWFLLGVMALALVMGHCYPDIARQISP